MNTKRSSINRTSNTSWPIVLILLFFGSGFAFAIAEGQPNGHFVDLMPKNKAEVELILQTLETSINNNGNEPLPPIVMMLHGAEAHRFVRGNYADNKDLVDQSAKLAAYGILDVQICETWMGENNYSKSDLFPFVQGVPLGTAELERLSSEEGYVEFSVSM